ncbi:MAG TPA: rhomboid family intramembrane serine protease [Verrucomicrobiae bacterium]
MLDDRSYMRADPHRSRWSATVVIIIAVTACFALQEIAGFYFHKRAWTAEYLGLSTDGLRAGFVWQLITFQFLHGGPMHLIFNLLTLWFFGRPVEERLGSRSFLKLYFICGAAGGLLQGGLGFLPNQYFGHTTYGASAGICGIIAAFALIEPEAEIRLWCVLPIKAKHLLWFGGGLALFFTLVPSDSGVAHAAHLGGYLAGIAYMRWDAARPAVNWNPLQGRRRKRQLVQAAAQITRWRGAREPSATELPPEEFISREVDPILDKISAHGIHSLTPGERKILEAARAKMARK